MKSFFINIYLSLRSTKIAKRLDKLVSPLFLAMVLAAFMLWYISKLGYSYTTELNIEARIDNQNVELNCVVEGVGSNLLGYKVKGGAGVKIPLSELQYETSDGWAVINYTSLLNAISLRLNDIKIVSIETPQGVKIEIKE